MLIGIGRRAPIDAGERRDDEVVGLLLACHGRIRSFLGLAARLADARGEPDASVAEAAARLLRYFGEALPLHALDEDVSLAPRLLDHGASDELRLALDATASEHADIERALDALSPLWTAISRDPAALAACAADLRAGAARLDDLFRVHLDREEQLIFPEVARLPAAVQRALVKEMRARRAEG